MAKAICIFSDGTGQAGGGNPIHWTNVYRLYKFTREIDPAKQIAFYDPGLGADPDQGDRRPGFLSGATRWLSQATGLGITDNIIDCYAAILLAWRPGDRILLFGFSRGAYTVRSLGGALALCGVPAAATLRAPVTAWSDFAARLDETRPLATEAVKQVYQTRDETERMRKAAEFRAAHRSHEAAAYFVGVWDTVRALGVQGINGLIDALGFRHRFHNAALSAKTPHGRQALSIDEDRQVFMPELWDERVPTSSQTVRQTWFAGVHADIGGGYPDSRGLSDLALAWMIDEAKAIEHPLIVDPALDPPLAPDPLANQHDERRTSFVPWLGKDRREFIASGKLVAPVRFHESVAKRLAAPTVPHLGVMKPYRPEALRERPEFAGYY